ncbi:MAG: DNA ligase D [Bauldia sp.]|nr:DNA ligase D [Bauldia sp.]
MPAKDRLKPYREKRDFRMTGEPAGKVGVRRKAGLRYLIQKHDATRLHFDFRLELNGVLLSWAVTRGPSYDPKEKRLAVHVEDHPLEYGGFEGTIPKGSYGGGTVMLWDEGTWEPAGEPVGDPEEALAKGDFKFILRGERLKGKWVLVRMKAGRGGKYAKENKRAKHENWLLIKERDEYAEGEKKPIIERALTSVRSGRTMEEIAAGNIEWVEGFRFKEGAPKKKGGKAVKSDRADPPKFVAPQLATLVDAPPEGKDWLHEIKFDGYRIVAAIGGGKAVTYTRSGLDWTDKFRPIVRPLADLPVKSALIDGEAVVRDEKGRSDFGKLQNAIADGQDSIVYFAFDLLFLDGEDLRKLPLIERKKRLAALLADQPRAGPLFYSDHVVGNGRETYDRACAMNLEGIVSKRADAPYRSERTRSWLKAKCGMGQEFIIVGWQPSKVKARPFSSILVATRDEDKLTYRGRVGSGFGERDLDAIAARFEKLAVKTPPLDDVPEDIRRASRFVKPELVAEVDFVGWTGDGYVRQGAFKGLRSDKKASDIVREMPKPVKNADPPAVITVDGDRDAGTIEISGVRVTHPNRVVFAGQKITKRQLIDYYLGVAGLILPHVADRPLSIVRCPAGADGDCFFQKHASPGFPDAFKPITIKEKEAKGEYLYITGEKGLVAAVQMGVLELHIWGSHVKTLEKPDRIVFDFDPDEAIDFGMVRLAAEEMRDRLKALGLASFAMATGGKGIHVVLPLKPHDSWEDVKAFAEAMARTMAADSPDRYLAEMSKTRRKGRIFIDYLRNGRGATAIAPYSTRARKGAPLAWPVSWAGLAKLKSAHEATVDNAAAILKREKTNPWRDYFAVKQVLPLKALRRK